MSHALSKPWNLCSKDGGPEGMYLDGSKLEFLILVIMELLHINFVIEINIILRLRRESYC